MDQFYKMDVFFFLTSIAVVVLIILLIICSFYVIKILRNVKYIVEKAKQETDNLAADIHDLRSNVREEGIKLKNIGNFIHSIYKKSKK